MVNVAVWGQILFVLGCVAYSTYALFQGDFEQAFLPYPILIMYYLIFARKRVKGQGSEEDEDGEGGKS